MSKQRMKNSKYTERSYWCNTHNRYATSIVAEGLYKEGNPCCAYGLGGILLPCNVVDITDILVIEKVV